MLLQQVIGPKVGQSFVEIAGTFRVFDFASSFPVSGSPFLVLVVPFVTEINNFFVAKDSIIFMLSQAAYKVSCSESNSLPPRFFEIFSHQQISHLYVWSYKLCPPF